MLMMLWRRIELRSRISDKCRSGSTNFGDSFEARWLYPTDALSLRSYWEGCHGDDDDDRAGDGEPS